MEIGLDFCCSLFQPGLYFVQFIQKLLFGGVEMQFFPHDITLSIEKFVVWNGQEMKQLHQVIVFCTAHAHYIFALQIFFAIASDVHDRQRSSRQRNAVFVYVFMYII